MTKGTSEMAAEQTEFETPKAAPAGALVLRDALERPKAAKRTRSRFQPIEKILDRFDTMEDMFAAA